MRLLRCGNINGNKNVIYGKKISLGDVNSYFYADSIFTMLAASHIATMLTDR